MRISGSSEVTPPENQPIWLTWQLACHSFFFLLFSFFFAGELVHVQFAPLCMCACVRACAEMRPVCLLLSQIAPMRDPKITTKGPQWVGWKPCHQPFQHRDSPPLLYLWVTPHTSHGDRKGRQSLIFDRNKHFCMLIRLSWLPPTTSFFPYYWVGKGAKGLRLWAEWLCGLPSCMWSHIHDGFGRDKSCELMNNQRHDAIQAGMNSTFFCSGGKKKPDLFSFSQKVRWEEQYVCHVCAQLEPEGY